MRKTVTALFCDLVGSTSFGEKVDAESARDAMGRYHAMAKATIEDHGGTVAKFIGDGVMALFGAPEVAEDDAERAVRTGLALQDGFGEIREHIGARHGVEVGLRVGINTGEVVIAADDADIVGDALNTAARLEAACEPGRVLVGESTFRLTRAAVDFAERGEIDAKGKDEPVAAYEVVAAHPVVGSAEELATPFVGRDDELRRLRLVLEDTILERRAGLVTVIGSPGVGKTRLAREMRAAVEGGTRAFELRCEREGTATFAPIAELLRTVAGITDAHTVDEMAARVRSVVSGLVDADRIGELLGGFVGAGPMRSTEEMFLAVRRLFEVLGDAQPVVLVVDDIQWAEPLFLDLLEHLAEWVQTVPLMIVCLARPEIREVRPVLTEKGRRVAEVVNLEGLGAEATSELAARLVGADALPAELLARIPESTEGNPLFVRELMRMLVADGVISEASGRWEMMIDVEAVEVPPTINSLLASRVERMSPEERRVLELASVVGSEFPIGALEAAGDQSRPALETAFERLRRKELIEPTGSYWGDEPVYRFHHVLIRDAAYRRLLKGARAELHTVVGEWTERSAAALVGEHEVTIGNHFEQAHLYRHELDLDDKETKALGERAARLFHVAADRALQREDLAAAATLSRRALGCVDDDDEQIAELLLLGCEAVLSVGDLAEGVPLVERLASVAGDDARLGAWVDCFRVQVAVLADPDGLHDAEQLADDAAQRLDELGDQAGVAKARIQRAAALVRLARVGECETELDLALSAARAVDDRRRVTAVLGSAPIAALWGPSPVPRAGGRCLDVVRLLRITTGSPAVEATSIRCQAVLEALRGRFETARKMLDAARSTVEELGLTHDLLETEYYAGLVELFAADPVAAEPHLRQAHEGLGRMGIGADRGQAGAHLARALLLQGRLDEAEELVVESEAVAGQNRQTAIASGSVHAEILSARGRHDEALTLADEAVAVASDTDILVDHAYAVAARARVLGAAGDAAAAGAAADAANVLYEQKGAAITVEVGAVSGLVDEPDRPLVVPDTGSGAWNRADGRTEQFDAADVDAAEQPWNDADRVCRRMIETQFLREFEDWDGLIHDDLVVSDRRAGALTESAGKKAVIADFWEATEGLWPVMSTRIETIAVRGDDLVLHRAAATDIGGVDALAEWFSIGRIVDGRSQLVVLMDPDDLRAAVGELDRLHCARLPAVDAALFRAWVASPYNDLMDRDLERFMGRFSPDVTVHDVRSLGFPELDRGGLRERTDSLLEVAASLVAVVERVHRFDPFGTVETVGYRIETHDGASFEIRSTMVVLQDGDNDASGLANRIEQFEAGDEAAAVERFDALRAESGRQITPNLAVAIGGEVNTWMRVDEPEIDRLVADPDRLFSDGRHPFGVLGRRVVAVRGERLSLVEVVDDGVSRWSVEEVDADGRLSDWTVFAAADIADACAHLSTREREVGEVPWTVASEFDVARRERGSEGAAEFLAPDAVFVDHRPLGYGQIDRAALLESGLLDSGEDGIAFWTECLRQTEHGTVTYFTVVHTESGAPVTNDGITVIFLRNGLVASMEIFDEHDAAAALSRFDELVAGAEAANGPVLPEVRNLASDTWTERIIGDGFGDPAAARRWLRSDFEYEIHFPVTGSRGGLDEFIEELGSWSNVDFAVRFVPLAVRGERLALLEMRLDVADTTAAVHMFVVVECDADGLLRSYRAWEPSDLRVAVRQYNLRALDLPDESPVSKAGTEMTLLYNDHDWDGVAACFGPDAILASRSPASFGDLSLPDAVRVWSSLVEMVPDVLLLGIVQIRDEGDGTVQLSRRFGTDVNGGDVVMEHLMVGVVADGVIVGLESFDPEQLAEALTRLDEMLVEHRR